MLVISHVLYHPVKLWSSVVKVFKKFASLLGVVCHIWSAVAFFAAVFFFFNLRRLASKLLNHIATIDLVIFQNLNHSWAPWISSCKATHGLNSLATTKYSFGSIIFTVQMLDGSATAYSMLEGSNSMTQNCCLLYLI